MQAHPSSFVNKIVKDYQFGQTICVLKGQSEVVYSKNHKSGQKFTAYIIKLDEINNQTYLKYNNTIFLNKTKIYPKMYEVIKTKKNIYMIFQHLSIPLSSNEPQKLLFQIKQLYQQEQNKIDKQQLFINDSKNLCYLPSYFKKLSPSSFYSKFHNKSILVELYIELIQSNNRTNLQNTLMIQWDSQHLLEQIKPYIPKLNTQNSPNSKATIIGPKLSQNTNKTHQKTKNYDFDQDDSEIIDLMSTVHVNGTMKNYAKQDFMKMSKSKQQQPQNKQIGIIFNDVKKSMFDIKCKKILQQQKHLQHKVKQTNINMDNIQFQAYYESYIQIFSLFRITLKSYLKTYPKGFAGVISGYFLTLISILRRIQLIKDLQNNQDIFNLGLTHYNFQKYIKQLKIQIPRQAKMLVNFKTILQNSNLPSLTLQKLQPYLQNINQIDRINLQNFVFFYFTILLQKNKQNNYHKLLTLQTMYVLVNRNYQISYSAQDFPKKWDDQFYDQRKTIIEASVPNWSIQNNNSQL